MPLKVWNSISLMLLLAACQQQTVETSTTTLSDWQFQYDGEWHAAAVPGNNFSDLLNHGFIPDPFYGTHEDSVQWVAEREWVYRTTFSSSAVKNQSLLFKGLDTYAEVFLNDSLILKSDNMFLSYEVEVSSLLRAENELKIHFLPPHKEEERKIAALGYELPGGSRVFTRKAGFHYGWDWGPKITPAGIWRPVELLSWEAARLTAVSIQQESITAGKAVLAVKLNVEVEEDGVYQVQLNDSIYQEDLSEGLHQLNYPYVIDKPQLWWPVGHGEQHLYQIELSLLKEQQVLQKQSKKIGLRSIELITEKDERGESFYFEVNGKAVFMKGANYIPQDNLQNRVTNKDYRALLQDAIDANMNMLRVWGGGIYEEDIFYDLCDSLGILLWQDFMFACAMYPSDSLFLENVKEEARQNVERLSHHPSIALWCGNNEISEGWHRWGWQDAYTEAQKETIWKGYQKLFQGILAEANQILPYWESSPMLGRGDLQHQFQGDAHYWGVWHDAEPFTNFEKKVPRFMSEFGFQSFPELSTIAQFADSSQWSLESEVMKSHQKHPRGNTLILEYMAREYPVPSDFDEFVYASQILQAEGMRIGLEAHRRSQPYCMGTLYWQLNDCWPVASWSSRDYYGNWKALHYAAQEVFEPLALSLSMDEEGFIDLWAMSEVDSTIVDTFVVRLYDMQGQELWPTHEEAVKITDGAQLLKGKMDHYSEGQFMICELKKQGVKSKTLFTSLVKEMNIEQPNIQTTWKGDTLTLSTDIPAFQVYLHGLEGRFSDNFFTLLPHQEKKVMVQAVKKSNLQIYTLADLFE